MHFFFFIPHCVCMCEWVRERVSVCTLSGGLVRIFSSLFFPSKKKMGWKKYFFFLLSLVSALCSLRRCCPFVVVHHLVYCRRRDGLMLHRWLALVPFISPFFLSFSVYRIILWSNSINICTSIHKFMRTCGLSLKSFRRACELTQFSTITMKLKDLHPGRLKFGQCFRN